MLDRKLKESEAARGPLLQLDLRYSIEVHVVWRGDAVELLTELGVVDLELLVFRRDGSAAAKLTPLFRERMNFGDQPSVVLRLPRLEPLHGLVAASTSAASSQNIGEDAIFPASVDSQEWRVVVDGASLISGRVDVDPAPVGPELSLSVLMANGRYRPRQLLPDGRFVVYSSVPRHEPVRMELKSGGVLVGEAQAYAGDRSVEIRGDILESSSLVRVVDADGVPVDYFRLSGSSQPIFGKNQLPDPWRYPEGVSTITVPRLLEGQTWFAVCRDGLYSGVITDEAREGSPAILRLQRKPIAGTVEIRGARDGDQLAGFLTLNPVSPLEGANLTYVINLRDGERIENVLSGEYRYEFRYEGRLIEGFIQVDGAAHIELD